jgi:hypothetical protein
MREMTKGAVKRRQSSERGNSRLRMAVAFIAGMAITAVLAQTPVGAEIFSPRLIHEPVIPALPDAPDSLKPSGIPDNGNPVKPYMNELVWTPVKEVALPC